MNIKDLKDPRLHKAELKNEMVDILSRIVNSNALNRRPLLVDLVKLIEEKLDKGEENNLRRILTNPGSPKEKGVLIEALDHCVSGSYFGGSLQGLLFAIPVIVISAGKVNQRVPMTVPSDFDIHNLFDEVGAIANAKTIGFSDALTSINALERVSWIDLMRCNHQSDLAGVTLNDFPPADLTLDTDGEKIHLRYIVGLSVTSTRLAKFTESAANLSRWATNFTRRFDKFVNRSGLELLAIPRRPASLPRAIYDGIWAINELGLQLFLSSTLRQARLKFGEPEVSISSCSDNTVRIRCTSVFDDTFDQTYGWNLSEVDDFDSVIQCIRDLLTDCGITYADVSREINEVG